MSADRYHHGRAIARAAYEWGAGLRPYPIQVRDDGYTVYVIDERHNDVNGKVHIVDLHGAHSPTDVRAHLPCDCDEGRFAYCWHQALIPWLDTDRRQPLVANGVPRPRDQEGS